jgi:hypothetical protein
MENFYKQSVMLESERLIFRKLNENDFDDLAEMFRKEQLRNKLNKNTMAKSCNSKIQKAEQVQFLSS